MVEATETVSDISHEKRRPAAEFVDRGLRIASIAARKVLDTLQTRRRAYHTMDGGVIAEIGPTRDETIGPNPERLTHDFDFFEATPGNELSTDKLLTVYDGTLNDGNLAVQAVVDDDSKISAFRLVNTAYNAAAGPKLRQEILTSEPTILLVSARTPGVKGAEDTPEILADKLWAIRSSQSNEYTAYNTTTQVRLNRIAEAVLQNYLFWQAEGMGNTNFVDFRSWQGQKRLEQLGHAREEVATVYRDVLGRDPDDEGLAHYMKERKRGRDLGDIRTEMIASDEFRDGLEQRERDGDRASAIEEAYRRILRREIDEEGRKAYIDAGRPVNEVVAEMVRSQEFMEKFAIHPNGTKNL